MTCGETTGLVPQVQPSTEEGASHLDGAVGDARDDGDDDFPADSNRTARASDDSSPSRQPPMIIEEMKAELQAAQQAASPPRDAEVEPDTAERRPNSKPPDTGPPGSPPESENGRN